MRAALWAIVAVVLASAPAGTTSADAARAFLGAAFDLSKGELDRLERGQVVSRTLDGSEGREVATFGAVRIAITPAFYIERLADVASLKKADAILQIGTFGHPPTLQDVAGLTLDEADVSSLRDCRTGDCGVQLSADAIARFEREVDWRGPNTAARVERVMRSVLVDYVDGYQRTGAAMVYADAREPLHLGPEFAALARVETGGWQMFPGLKRHLLEYPAGREGMQDLIYWSKEKVGRRGVVSVTHLSISRTAGESPAEYAVASKQIYSSHYYDASLGLTVLVPIRASPAPSMYLAYLNRSRVDMFEGMFGSMVRRIVSSRARATVADNLARLQRTLERQFGAGVSAGEAAAGDPDPSSPFRGENVR
jgi:hypothetical protein